MSLKALHVVFIAASIVLAFGFGAWSLKAYSNGESQTDLWFGIGSIAAGVGLIVYGWAVLKKLKNISYL